MVKLPLFPAPLTVDTGEMFFDDAPMGAFFLSFVQLPHFSFILLPLALVSPFWYTTRRFIHFKE